MSTEKGQKHIYAQEHQLFDYYNNFRGHLEKKLRDSKQNLKHSRLRFGTYLRLKIRLKYLQNFTENDRKITQNNFCSKVLFKMKLYNI